MKQGKAIVVEGFSQNSNLTPKLHKPTGSSGGQCFGCRFCVAPYLHATRFSRCRRKYRHDRLLATERRSRDAIS